MAVFVIADGRLDLALIVDGLAGDVTEQGVEGRAADLAAVVHVKVGIIVLDVSKALVPAFLFHAAQLFALDLGDDGSASVGERLVGRQLRQGHVHGRGEQLITQTWCMFWPAVL